MTKTKLLRFIRESKILLSHATPEQKIRIVKLLKESVKHISQQSVNVSEKSNMDYLEEK
jgi:hypothetical protein